VVNQTKDNNVEAMAILTQMFAAEMQFIESDHDAIAAIFHPDIVVHEPASLPYAGDWRGYEELGRLFKSMRDTWSFINVENMRATIDGDTLFMCCTLVTTARNSGNGVRQPFSEVLKIKEGLVVEGTPYYYDTAAIIAALGDDLIGVKGQSSHHDPSVDDLDRTGEPIRFAIGQCSLGLILVATTRKGICAILLGDKADALRRDLHDRFPEAPLLRGDGELEQSMPKVVALVENPAVGLDLPLDPRGTAFQQRVWQALREIPAGSTASYSEIARRIGAPKEAYAVGEACAANTIAVAIPCHRVVRKDGALADYRWGFRRKRRLLRREAAS
jgi:O-6-methylguanine DNA methyltransferase